MEKLISWAQIVVFLVATTAVLGGAVLLKYNHDLRMMLAGFAGLGLLCWSQKPARRMMRRWRVRGAG